MRTAANPAARQSERRAARSGGAPRTLARWARDYLPALLLLAGLLGLWEAWVAAFDTKPYVLPAPSRVWEAFLQTREALPRHIRATLGEALLGLGLAAVVGVLLAAALALVPFVRRVLYPIIVVTQTVPMVVLAPLLIIWFGFGMTPKVLVVALVGFFPIVVSTYDGLASADREMSGLVRSMGGGRRAVFRYVLVPGAVPAFFAGLKIAAAYAMFGAVVGEWVGAHEGIGVYINRAQASFRVDRVFVGVAVIALLSMALFAAVHLIERVATPWKFTHREEPHQ